jgi:FKBP-type peptidyl-prolyl cis-trans isomerase FkpA
MRRFLLACAVSLALACGGGGAPSWTDPSGGDPAKAQFAATLGVDLAAMEKRASGLYVQDLSPGSGATATAGSNVSVNYTGWLTNGTEFDSSRGGSPFTFTLGVRQVIDGWDEGVAGMRTGGRRRLVIPSDLAYGASGYLDIPPNAVLVFEVELMGVR